MLVLTHYNNHCHKYAHSCQWCGGGEMYIGENVRYFMYKYKIVYDDWFNDLSNIFNTIDSHIQNTTQLDDVCLAGAIRELCEARDSGIVQFVDRNQICNMIDMLCTR